MKIRFIQRHEVRQGDGKGPTYAVGDEVEFNGGGAETYARKYIARGYAVDITNERKPREAAPAPVAATEPGPPQPAPTADKKSVFRR